jgi:hypothetical protein
MKLFKLIELDTKPERKRINKPGVYNKRQRKSLNALLDLFEAEKFQECLDFINDEKNFPYNTKRGYSEKEHIGLDIADVLIDMSKYNYYTVTQLLEDARKKLK